MAAKNKGGEMLRAWREKRDISQTEAARRVGTQQSTWAEWEHGNRFPGLTFAIAIEKETNGDVPVETWERPRRKRGERAA